MKELEILAPEDSKKEVEEVLGNYTSNFSSSKVEKNGENFLEFKVTLDSDSIDDITDDLKSIKQIDHGQMSINILEQESLIKKGQKTKGSRSSLSREEIYSKAQEFQGFDKIQWLLVGLSGAIASLGLVFENVIIVIGAMIFAPLLSPLVSSSISLVVGDRTMMKKSVLSSLKAFLLVIVVSVFILLPIPVSSNELIMMIVEPGISAVALSLMVGSAAALTFASGVRDQVAGVAVAIALVPPLASVGIGIRMLDVSMVLSAAAISSINILSVVLAGFVTFYLIGLRPSSYYSKRNAEGMRKIIGVVFVFLIIVAGGISFHSYDNYQDFIYEKNLESEAQQVFGDRLFDVRKTDSGYQIIVIGEKNDTKATEFLQDEEIIRLERSE